MTKVLAYGVASATSPLKPMTIERRALGAKDVKIAIDYCGVCHSDIHFAHNDWGFSQYPLVPGHEIVGRVLAVGSLVTRYQVGDAVGVGCMVDSCRHCAECDAGLQQYCDERTWTYNSPDGHGAFTYGGYSKEVVVDQDFVLKVPSHLDQKAVAPLLCAGITTWSPLRQWKVKKGDVVGVIGLGGLGHMGIKLAHALGAKVVMITRSTGKGADAKALGADEVLLSTDAKAMAAAAGRFDFLLNTIPVAHDVNPYLGLLKRDATMVMVGVVGTLPTVDCASLIFKRRRIAGSLIGGVAETQEMLDFCGKHNIVADVEMIKMPTINEAYDRMIKGDVKYRFVIDLKSLT